MLQNRNDAEYHRGIQISRIPVGGGIMGLLFVVGTGIIFLVGVPPLRFIALAAIPFGLIIAVAIYVWHKRRPVELSGLDDETRFKLS